MIKKPGSTAQSDHIIKVSYDPKEKLAVASTDSVDRHGEVIDQDGWDLKQFKSNPVMLWAHDNYEPAVGLAENLQVVKMGDKKALTFTPVFHGKTELSQAIDALYNGDSETGMKPVLNSFSVGFRPLETDGNTYTKNELLEISCVNVPANADARVLAYKNLVAKGISDQLAKDIVNPDDDGALQKVLDRLDSMDKDIKDLQSLAKGNIPSAPKAKVLGKRQMLAKAITRAADLLSESDKNKTLPPDQRKQLVKIIKRAGDKITASQKEELRHG